MCHQSVRPHSHIQSPAPGGRPGLEPPQGDTGPGLAPPEEEPFGNHGNDGGAAEVYECPPEREEGGEEEEEGVEGFQEEEEEEGDGSDGDITANDLSHDDLNMEAVQGLCFSSSGNFVGFGSPGSSCSAGGGPSPGVPWDEAVGKNGQSRAKTSGGEGDGLTETEESLPPPPPPSLSSSSLAAAVGRQEGEAGGLGGERGRPSADLRMNASSCAAPQNRTGSCEPGFENHSGAISKADSALSIKPESLCDEDLGLEGADSEGQRAAADGGSKPQDGVGLSEESGYDATLPGRD